MQDDFLLGHNQIRVTMHGKNHTFSSFKYKCVWLSLWTEIFFEG